MDDCVLRGLLSLLACLSQLFLLIKVNPLSLSLYFPLCTFPPPPSSNNLKSPFLCIPQWFDLLVHLFLLFWIIFKWRFLLVPCLLPSLLFLSVGFVLVCVFCVNRMHPEGKTHAHRMSNLHNFCVRKKKNIHIHIQHACVFLWMLLLFMRNHKWQNNVHLVMLSASCGEAVVLWFFQTFKADKNKGLRQIFTCLLALHILWRHQELREKQVRQQAVLDDLHRVKEEKLRELQRRREEEERERRRREEEEEAARWISGFVCITLA